MHRHPDYTRDRIRQFCERLRKQIYSARQPALELLVSPQVDRITRAEAQTLKYRSCKLGEAFGPQWAAVVPLLLILAPVGALQAISTTVGNIYQALGRTDLLVRFAAVAGLLSVVAFVIGLQWGIVGVAACYALMQCGLAYSLFKIPLGLIGLQVTAVVQAVGRALLCSLGMLAAVYSVDRLLPDSIDSAARLSVLVLIGVVGYSASTWFFNREGAVELVNLVRQSDA